MEDISNATVRAYLMEMTPHDRTEILKSKSKLQMLVDRVAMSHKHVATAAILDPERGDNSKAELQALVDLFHKSVVMPKAAFEQHFGAGYRQADLECEVRFGTNRMLSRAFSKNDYNSVIQQFQQAGFTTEEPEGLHMLRITTATTKRNAFSNIRAEIRGLDSVQQYARTNDLNKVLDHVRFTQKKSPDIQGKTLKPVDFSDLNFRASFQLEKHWLPDEFPERDTLLSRWMDVKKTFRFMNRVRFRHPTHAIFLDVSIIKSSATEFNRSSKQRVPIPECTLQEAKLFENAETFEIELELDNARLPPLSSHVLASLRHCIRLVLSGLQGSPYPIGFAERNRVLQDYLALIQPHHDAKITSHHFIGPQPVTLQIQNLDALRTGYSVTDKADGDRKMLFVSPSTGKVYLLDTTMNVTYVGRRIKDEKQWNSLLDGEHLKRDRQGRITSLFKVFDVYFWNGQTKREMAFYEPQREDESLEQYEQRLRLPLLQKWVREAVIIGGPEGKVRHADFTLEAKTFLTTYEMDIFQACKEIWEAIHHPAYEYATDGLVFTPTQAGVGSDRLGHAAPLHKTTWKTAFKWKPPQSNTVDFLVRAGPFFRGTDSGTDLTAALSPKVKTLILCCGFNPRDHGYLNPRQMMLDDVTTTPPSGDYYPCPFEPADPADPEAHICDCVAFHEGNGEYVLKTEEGEYFDEDMIVEFRYDKSAPLTRRRWIPVRVRHDKTNELRMGYKNYGNAFHVAENNWHSIWYEVTEEMITTGNHIPTVLQDDVYYNRVGNIQYSRGMRQFHNHYVKRRLLLNVAKPNDHLIDFGVGKAGDLRKWAEAKIAFVWGIDLSQDNIENRKDGACARYIGLLRNQQASLPKAIFMQGNVEHSVKHGEAFVSTKDKVIAKALFGRGPKDKTELGNGVYPHYGIAERGFHIASCQFAVHYFFKNHSTLHAFLQNVAECTREQGHFICTCFDGNLVFDKLRHLSQGMAFTVMTEERHKVLEIVKQYDATEFRDDESSLGMAIDVFQDSINTSNREYLVNMAYFQREMENHGFVLQSDAFFRDLYAQQQQEEDGGVTMSEAEKTVSFLNRSFVFQKVRTTIHAKEVKESAAEQKAKQKAKEEEVKEDAAEQKATVKKPRFRPVANASRLELKKAT